MSKINKFIKIIDKNTNRVIASGKVINEKVNYLDSYNKLHDFFAISFDNKWFFNLNKKDNSWPVHILHSLLTFFIYLI